MDGLPVYQIVKVASFAKSYQRLIKTHYKKNLKARQAFEALIASFLEGLCHDPRPVGTLPEAFPKGTAGGHLSSQPIELRKQRWRQLPALEGAAGLGRLLYVICESSRLIYPLWIYTHQEFAKRPADKDLKRELKAVIKDRQQRQWTEAPA